MNTFTRQKPVIAHRSSIAAQRGIGARTKVPKYNRHVDWSKPASERVRSRAACHAATSSTQDVGPPPNAAAPECLHAVACFVQRSDESLLFIRQANEGGDSPSIRAIEALLTAGESPVERAKLQVQSELGLPASSLYLLCCGRPLLTEDGCTVVHPFLFAFDDSNGATLASERSFEWLPPGKLDEHVSAMHLRSLWQRVHVNAALLPYIEGLHCDRAQGATQLASWVNNCFMQLSYLAQQGEIDPEADGMDEMDLLRNCAYIMATCRPSMPAIAHAAALIINELEDEMIARADPFGPTLGEVRTALLSVMQTVEYNRTQNLRRLSQHMTATVSDAQSLITLSKSTAVLHALLQLQKSRQAEHSSESNGATAPLHVVVCEGRPLCEGAVMATELAQQSKEVGLKVDVHVITEAQASSAILDGCSTSKPALFGFNIDAVVVGADFITASGIMNKVGTLMLALAARAAQIPFYVVADTGKISPGPVMAMATPWGLSSTGETEENDVSQIVAAWPERTDPALLSVRNTYFEQVPFELITAVVTEHGVLDVSRVPDFMQRQRDAFIRAFQLSSPTSSSQ